MNLHPSSVESYAAGASIVAEALKAFLPPEPTNVADYVAQYRYLSNDGGGYVGRWNHDQAPFLIAPMAALSDESVSAIAVVGPGQTGKTEIARNWLFTSALSDPADMLWYSASEPLVASEVKKNISKMVNDHPALRQILSRDSIAFKKFGSMTVEFLAGIAGNLISKSAPRIIADEFDAICESVPNAKELMDVRRRTFGERSKLIAISHPDLVEGYDPNNWNAGIMELYRDSTRQMWGWQCPHCGAWSSPNPAAKRVMQIHYDERAPLDEIRDMATLLCPVNGCLVEDSQRYAMNLTGKWYGRGQELEEDGTISGAAITRPIAGFWIVGAMSTLSAGGIGELAEIEAKTSRKFAIDRDRKTYRSTISKNLGILLQKDQRAEAIDAAALAARADSELTLGRVPQGVRFITVMIDVQGNRFEMLARGWYAGGRSVVVDYRSVEASPSGSAADWDAMLALATQAVWPLEGLSGYGMKAHVVGFDSAGQDGVTLQAYAAWRRAKAAGRARRLGRIDGRDAWSLLPLKGASPINAPRLQVVFPDLARGDRFAGARGDVPLGVFNPNLFKDDLNGQLLLAENVDWHIGFPAVLKEMHRRDLPPAGVTDTELLREKLLAEGPFPWFEQLVAEQRQHSGRWSRIQDGRPNEALDLMVGTHVLAFLLGIQRMRWDAAPPWARLGTDNPDIVALNAPAANLSESPALTRMDERHSGENARRSPAHVTLVDSVPVRH